MGKCEWGIVRTNLQEKLAACGLLQQRTAFPCGLCGHPRPEETRLTQTHRGTMSLTLILQQHRNHLERATDGRLKVMADCPPLCSHLYVVYLYWPMTCFGGTWFNVKMKDCPLSCCLPSSFTPSSTPQLHTVEKTEGTSGFQEGAVISSLWRC